VAQDVPRRRSDGSTGVAEVERQRRVAEVGWTAWRRMFRGEVPAVSPGEQCTPTFLVEAMSAADDNHDASLDTMTRRIRWRSEYTCV